MMHEAGSQLAGEAYSTSALLRGRKVGVGAVTLWALVVAACGGDAPELEIEEQQQAAGTLPDLIPQEPGRGMCGVHAHEVFTSAGKICACNSCYKGDPYDGCVSCASGCISVSGGYCVAYTPPPNPCQDVACGANARCVSGICSCYDGYTGDAKAGCTPKPCAAGAFRLLGSGPAMCVCPTGTTSSNPESLPCTNTCPAAGCPTGQSCDQSRNRCVATQSYFEDQKTRAQNGVKGAVRVSRFYVPSYMSDQYEIQLLRNGVVIPYLTADPLSNGCGPRAGMHLLSWFGLSPLEQAVSDRMKNNSWHWFFGYWGTAPVFFRSAIEYYLNQSLQNSTTTTTCTGGTSPLGTKTSAPVDAVAPDDGELATEATGTEATDPSIIGGTGTTGTSGAVCTTKTTYSPVYSVHLKNHASIGDLRKALLHGAPVAVLVTSGQALHWVIVSAIDEAGNVQVIDNTSKNDWTASEFMQRWNLDLWPPLEWTLDGIGLIFDEYGFKARTMIYVTAYGKTLDGSTTARYFSGPASLYPTDPDAACRKFLDEHGSKYNELFKLAVDNRPEPVTPGSSAAAFTCRIYDGTQAGLIDAADQGTAYEAGQTISYCHVRVASTQYPLACEWVVNGTSRGKFPCQADNYLKRETGSSVSFRIHPASDGTSAQHVSF